MPLGGFDYDGFDGGGFDTFEFVKSVVRTLFIALQNRIFRVQP